MRRQQYRAHVPEAILRGEYRGDLYGFYHEETGRFNITGGEAGNASSTTPGAVYLGSIRDGDHDQTGEPVSDDTPHLIGLRTADGLQFRYRGEAVEIQPYSLVQDILSRNTGILETDHMLNARAIISGVGSVGSLVALELARAGAGHFVLVDNDILEYHNLCRHQCGISDVGRYKVDAVRDRILAINPTATVTMFRGILERAPQELYDQKDDAITNTVVVGCADNREADLWASQIAKYLGAGFVSIGFWERAAAGEIFYWTPESDADYGDLVAGIGSDLSNRVSTNRKHYTTEEDLSKVNFEPGISVDITFVTVVGLKVIVDLLNRDNPAYTPRVIDSLRQFTLVCNTNKTAVGGDLVDIFTEPLQVTRSIVVVARRRVS
jgi:molybdopterin/thiamine biosynthesis adenylyltransferase